MVITSAKQSSSLHVSPKLAVYTTDQTGAAHLYLTDLPIESLDPEALPADIAGTVTHIQLFLEPRAGKTPRNANASTCTVEVFVVAHGHVGMYGGGGYLQPGGEIGTGTVSATMHDASLSPLRHSDGFDDVLGPSTLDLSQNFDQSIMMANTLDEVCDALEARATHLAVTKR